VRRHLAGSSFFLAAAVCIVGDCGFFGAATVHIFSSVKKLVPCGTDGRLLLSGFQAVVTLTLDRVIRHTVCITHRPVCTYQMSLKLGKSAGTARSRDIKTRTNIKNLTRPNLDRSLLPGTGSIARSANLPVLSLLRGRFRGFSPRRGDTLHRWG